MRGPFYGLERGEKNHGGSSSEGRCLSCAALRMESEESQHASFCCVMPMYLTDRLGAVGLYGFTDVQ